MTKPHPLGEHTVYLGETHDLPLSHQGGECPTGECHRYGSHCGRCGGCSGYRGHYWGWCSVTKDHSEFHFCCPDDCELVNDDA